MATKKPTKTVTKPKPATKPKVSPRSLENLAARPSFEDMDEQLVDHSGVFRVTSAIAQEQIGHEDEAPRFANDSLVMQAQRDGFREDAPDEPVDNLIDDETTAATKRQRLATLAALAARKPKRR